MADTGTSIAQLIGQLKSSNANLPSAAQAVGGKESGGENRTVVVNVNATPSDTQSSNQDKVVDSLDKIYAVLLQQLNFDKSAEQQKRMEIQVRPQDFQKEMIDQNQRLITAVKEEKKTEDNDSGILGIGGLVRAIGSFIPKMGGLITAIGEFAPAIATLVAAVAGFKAISSALSWAAEKLGSNSISPGLGGFYPDLPSKEYSKPMSPEEFQQNRIPKTLGGETSRTSASPEAKPMSQEEFQEKRITKSEEFSKQGSFNDNAPVLMRRLMNDFDLSREQAAGVVGNLGHESAGLQAGIQEKNPRKGRGGLGWAQWTGPRRKEFEAYLEETGQAANDPEANYGFLKRELKGSQKSAIEAVKKESTISGSTKVFEGKFERAAADAKHYESRNRYAERAYKMELPENNNQFQTVSKENVENSSMVNPSDLRIKGGLEGQATKGGESQTGTMNLARSLQARESELPGGLNRFTAFNDEYHHKANPNSMHTKGLAMDITLNDSKKSAEAAEYIKNHLTQSGLSEKDFKIIDEYSNPSKHSTGGHLHVNFANEKAAKSYADYTNGGNETKYAKLEKEIPEGKGYGEEESEEEETSEKIIEEPTTNKNSDALDLAYSKLGEEAKAEGMSGFGEKSEMGRMVDLLSMIANNTGDMAKSEEEKETTSKEEKSSEETQKEDQTAYSKEEQTNDLTSNLTQQGFDNINQQANPLNSFGNILSSAGTMAGGISSIMSGISGMHGGDTRSIINSVNGMLGMGTGMMRGMGNSLGNVFGGMMNGGGNLGGMGGGISQTLGQIGNVLGSVGGMMNGGGNLGGIGGVLGNTFGGSLGGLIGSAGGGALGGLFNSVSSGGGIGDTINSMMNGAVGSAGGVGGILGSLGVTGFGGNSGNNFSQTAMKEGTGQYPGREGGFGGSLDDMMLQKSGIQREEGFPTMGGMGKEEYLKRQSRGETFDPKTGAGSGGVSTPRTPMGMKDVAMGALGIGKMGWDLGTGALEGLYNFPGSMIGNMLGIGGGDSISSKGIGDDAASIKSKSGSMLESLGVSGIGEGLGTSSLVGEGNSMIGGALDGLQSAYSSMMGTTSSSGGESSSGGGSSVAIGNAGGGGGSSGGGGGGSAGFKSGDQRAGSSSGAMGIQMGVRNEESILQKAQYSVIRIV